MKVLHVVGGLDFGGIEKWLSNIFKYSNEDCENYVISMSSDKRGIVPYLNIARGRIFFTKKNNLLYRVVRLYQVIKEVKPDVLHSHAGYSSGLYALIARLLNVKVLVVHSHSDRRDVDKNASYLKRCYIFLMKTLIDWLDVRRISVSKGSGHSLYKSKFDILYCGVEVNSADVEVPELSLLKSDGKMLIFHIGRYTEAKNFEFILSLLKKFRRLDKYHFVFISGELDEFRKDCARQNIKNVTFLGQVEDPTRLMHKYADLFILPSKWEGLPLSAVEAQLSGVTTILSSKITDEVDLGSAIYLDLDLVSWESAIIDSEFKDNDIRDDEVSRFSIEKNVEALGAIYNGS
ncbi:glycosyltransferase [Vibrio vulnificus]|nr:glycosyltransferase family 1 protein [Vibrio vulnificus]EMA2414145.1 glycosyltransferase [Vibrio vulnificus]MCU8102707.1 glycosyltransferase [Vibrio vulnificus]HAS8312849.1 glycosyltransferase [Vibrio vulnificus]